MGQTLIPTAAQTAVQRAARDAQGARLGDIAAMLVQRLPDQLRAVLAQRRQELRLGDRRCFGGCGAGLVFRAAGVQVRAKAMRGLQMRLHPDAQAAGQAQRRGAGLAAQLQQAR
jgi:hypothetical protein